MIRNIVFVAFVAIYGASAFAPRIAQHQRTDVKLAAQVDRRTMLANAAAVAAGVVLAPNKNAFALNSIPADNEIVKEQRTVTGRIDINNAPVADYMQLPGMYPGIGGKIANSGPYKSVKDVYKLESLTANDKATIKKYESALAATKATGLDTMRGRDPYRKSFNQFATLEAE